MTGAAFAAGQPAGSLVRVLQDDINGAVLQVDADGSVAGRDWTTIARLDGVHTGATVNVMLSAAQPGGTTLTARDGFLAAPGSDFNGDAKGDLLLQNDAGEIHVLSMNGAQVLSDQLAGQTSADWHIYGTGDFNGDGKADILLDNDDGRIQMLTMNGAQVTASDLAGRTRPPGTWSARPTSTATPRPTSCCSTTTARSTSSP